MTRKVRLVRGKGGRKAKGRGRGNKFRTVDGEEEEYEECEDDYEDEGEPEGDEGADPEPEGEDPSGSVNHINQMTICVVVGSPRLLLWQPQARVLRELVVSHIV